jgi:hypothetical protein
MQNADNSYAARTRRLASQTLALFHRNNPETRELGPNILDESTYLVRKTGDMHNIIQTISSRIDEPGCSCEAAAAAPNCTDEPASFTINISVTEASPFNPPYDIYNSTYNIYDTITWDPVEGATSYTVTVTNDYYDGLVIYTGGTTALVFQNLTGPDMETITVTALNDCGSSIASGAFAPCFLAGSLVTLADGTQKVIEEVAVGDQVLGAFGEINTVLAVHRPLLGSYYMVHINGEHYSSAHHPHVTADKQFVCAEPAVVDNETYGREHVVINAEGQEELRMLHGLRPGRVQKLLLGAALKTVGGSRLVESLERADMPPETQLYNLVVGGSHTYHVDGYAVTGWPREDDFDYDAWVPRGEPMLA